MENVPRRSATPSEPSRLDELSTVLEQEILPRLLVSHRAGPVAPDLLLRAAELLQQSRVEELVSLLRGASDERLERYVEDLLEDGVATETIYLDFLAPAARRLGVMWEEDECDFVEVTLALGRMQRVLRSLSHLFLASEENHDPVARIYLTCVDGEQHSLGLVMVAEFFLRAGWAVEMGHPVSEPDLLRAVRSEWCDVVGFSVGCDSRVNRLKREIRDVRRASRNPLVRVLVGGRVFDDQPDLAARVGADATIQDPRLAPDLALRMVRGTEAALQ